MGKHVYFELRSDRDDYAMQIAYRKQMFALIAKARERRKVCNARRRQSRFWLRIVYHICVANVIAIVLFKYLSRIPTTHQLIKTSMGGGGYC